MCFKLELPHASLCTLIAQSKRDEIIGAHKVGACITKIAKVLEVPTTSVDTVSLAN